MGKARPKRLEFVENFFLLQAKVERSVRDRGSKRTNMQNGE